MCVIIYRKKGTAPIKSEYLTKCIDNNPDGWGISYFNSKSKKVIVSKSLDMTKAFKAVRDLEEKDIEFIFHARIATIGEVSTGNCHPNMVGNHAMFHNGTFKTINISNKSKSDSWHFGRLLVKPWIKLKKDLDTCIESLDKIVDTNRLAFMCDNGDVKLYGAWSEIDEIKYSNTRWRYSFKGRQLSAYSGGSLWNRNSHYEEINYDYQYNTKAEKYTESKQVEEHKNNSIIKSHIKNLIDSRLDADAKKYYLELIMGTQPELVAEVLWVIAQARSSK